MKYELAINYSVPEPSSSKPKKSKKPYPKFQHEWSTVFVVITWGKIVEM